MLTLHLTPSIVFDAGQVTRANPFALVGSLRRISSMRGCSGVSASPASPIDYARLGVETLLVGSAGTLNTLEIARLHNAGYLHASTSECYGDPEVHPQTETYWGNVNPIGPRSVYDEAKRFSEATVMAFHRYHGDVSRRPSRD